MIEQAPMHWRPGFFYPNQTNKQVRPWLTTHVSIFWHHIAHQTGKQKSIIQILNWPCKNSVCSRNGPQPCLDPPPQSEWHDGQRQMNEAGKCIRENTALRTKFRGGVRVQACHAAVWIEFAFWPLRRDYHFGVLIGAGGRRRSDWPARVLANGVSTRIDR